MPPYSKLDGLCGRRDTLHTRRATDSRPYDRFAARDVGAASSRPCPAPATTGTRIMPPYGKPDGLCGRRDTLHSGRATDSRPYDRFAARDVGAASSRPCPAPATTGAGTYRTRFRRHVGMPPYGVRRGCGGNRGGLLGRPYRLPLRCAAHFFPIPYSIPSCPLTFSGGFAIM